MRVSILQPTYWARAHVWNRIFNSDVFVWLDSVKFSRSSTKWEDRTVVESTDGRPIVLRLPLRGSRTVLWRHAGLNDGWRRHEKTIRQCYSRRHHFDVLEPLLDAVYKEDALTIDEVCWRTLWSVAALLSPRCRFVRSSELGVQSAKGELVLDLVKAVGGSSYLTGAPGAAYLPRESFRKAGILVEVQDWAAPATANGLPDPSVLHLLANRGAVGTAEVLRVERTLVDVPGGSR